MLTAVLSLASALGSTVHDILMMRVVRSTPVFTALFWVQSVALVMFVPLWLIAVGLPNGAEQWRAVGLAALSGPVEVLGLAALLKALSVGKLSIVAPAGRSSAPRRSASSRSSSGRPPRSPPSRSSLSAASAA